MRKKIALLGLGVVGSGVATILQQKQDAIAERLGYAITIGKVLELRPERLAEVGLSEDLLARSIDEIVADPEIVTVAEVMGGADFAFTCAQKTLSSGKNYVTSNKELIAKHGLELAALADKHQVRLHVEASVCGGIPLLATLENECIANDIKTFMAIANGTTNYILTKMRDEGIDFDIALQNAQELGYAEADPTADVEGYDAQYKLAILARLLFGISVQPDAIHREGITRITATDLKAATKLGYALKLLAVGKSVQPVGSYILRCTPALIPANHQLAHVEDVFNGFFLTGDYVGDLMLYGRGAGSLPTASAVVADIVRTFREHGVPRLQPTLGTDFTIKPLEYLESRFYLRFADGTKDDISKQLSAEGIPVEQVIGIDKKVAVLTGAVQEAFLREKLMNISSSSYKIRVEEA